MRRTLSILRSTLPYWMVTRLVDWLPESTPTVRLKGALARYCVGRCGRRFGLGREVTLNFPDRFAAGDDCYIARGGWVQAMGGVTLGDGVVCGPFVVLASTNHERAVHRIADVSVGTTVGAGTRPEAITIGDGTWIGAHAVVTAGVSIGRGCVIGAGAVVTRSTGENELWAGVPARRIRSLDQEGIDAAETAAKNASEAADVDRDGLSRPLRVAA